MITNIMCDYTDYTPISVNNPTPFLFNIKSESKISIGDVIITIYKMNTNTDEYNIFSGSYTPYILDVNDDITTILFDSNRFLKTLFIDNDDFEQEEKTIKRIDYLSEEVMFDIHSKDDTYHYYLKIRIVNSALQLSENMSDVFKSNITTFYCAEDNIVYCYMYNDSLIYEPKIDDTTLPTLITIYIADYDDVIFQDENDQYLTSNFEII